MAESPEIYDFLGALRLNALKITVYIYKKEKKNNNKNTN